MATRKWNSEFQVNTTTTGNQNQSSVTGLADGGFIITWRDDGPADSQIRWQRYDAAGAKLGLEQTTLFGANDQTLPQVVQLSDGNLWFVDQDDDLGGDFDIDGKVYSLTGTFMRSQAPSDGTSLPDTTPSSASLGANGSVAVWHSSGNAGDIQMRGFNTDGTERFAIATVNTSTAGDQASPAVATSPDGSHFVVTWRQPGAVLARVFDSSGVETASEFTVSTPGSNTPQVPDITWLGNDRFVATWTVFDTATSADPFDTAIKYAIFNANGTALGTERLANSTVTGFQTEQAITALPNGGFVIAWRDVSQTGGDTSDSAIRLQVFDGVGDKRGSEILVNTTTLGDQASVSLATLADGRVTVSWSDFQTGEVRAQIIDPRDGIIDGTSGVDTLYGHDSVGDTMSGFDGADILNGLAGADTIYGGAGGDIVNGGRGDDTVFGGNDGDNLRGDAGDDELYGEDGSDTLLGGLGADFLNGGDGFDFANYHFARGVYIDMNDPLVSTGEAFGDSFFSIEGIVGSAGFADTILGDVNPNIIYGQGGADILDGRGGGDTLYGGAAGDTMTGGAGPDRFLYVAATEGGDTITDFAAGDKVQLTGAAFGLTVNPGFTLTAAAFRSGAGNTSTDGNTRVIVDTTTHTLWVDSDGTGANAAVLLATFTNNYNPIIADFLVT
jgi:Ca2+-binding RTX toxin-like protein